MHHCQKRPAGQALTAAAAPKSSEKLFSIFMLTSAVLALVWLYYATFVYNEFHEMYQYIIKKISAVDKFAVAVAVVYPVVMIAALPVVICFSSFYHASKNGVWLPLVYVYGSLLFSVAAAALAMRYAPLTPPAAPSEPGAKNDQ